MVVFLAERMGWTIEYVMNLTMIQVSSIFNGLSDIAKRKEKESSADDGKGNQNRKDGGRQANDLQTLQMLTSMSGKDGKNVFNMTNKAKDALKKVYDRKVKRMKAKEDARNRK